MDNTEDPGLNKLKKDLEETVKKYNRIYAAWWSLFAPLWLFKEPFRLLFKTHTIVFQLTYGTILIFLSTATLLPIYGFINNTFLCRRDFIHVLASLRQLCSTSGVVAMLLAAWFGRNAFTTHTLSPDCYYDITTQIAKNEIGKCCCESQKCCANLKSISACILSFFNNFVYSWLLLFTTVGYFTFGISDINPDVHLSETTVIEKFILAADFSLATIRVYHIQFFLIICQGISTKIRFQLKPIVFELEKSSTNRDISTIHRTASTLDVNTKHEEINVDNGSSESIDEIESVEIRIKNHINSIECQQKKDHRRLINMARSCIDLKKTTLAIDRKIRWFTFFGAIEFFLGLSTPFFQLLHTVKTKRNLTIALYTPWLILETFFAVYCCYKAYRISSNYKMYVTRFKRTFSSSLICAKCPDLKTEFQLIDDKVFKHVPSLTLGGFLNIGTPQVCSTLTALKLTWVFAAIKFILDANVYYEEPKSVQTLYFTNCLDAAEENGTIVNSLSVSSLLE